MMVPKKIMIDGMLYFMFTSCEFIEIPPMTPRITPEIIELLLQGKETVKSEKAADGTTHYVHTLHFDDKEPE